MPYICTTAPLFCYARLTFVSGKDIYRLEFLGIMANITIYSKKECHLCDIAKEELEVIRQEFDFLIREVDIEKDPIAFEKFRYLIPVVEVDGEIISTGSLNRKKFTDNLLKTIKKSKKS